MWWTWSEYREGKQWLKGVCGEWKSSFDSAVVRFHLKGAAWWKVLNVRMLLGLCRQEIKQFRSRERHPKQMFYKPRSEAAFSMKIENLLKKLGKTDNYLMTLININYVSKSETEPRQLFSTLLIVYMLHNWVKHKFALMLLRVWLCVQPSQSANHKNSVMSSISALRTWKPIYEIWLPWGIEGSYGWFIPLA